MSIRATTMPAALPLLLAAAAGLTVANLYYAQPLIGPISLALGLPTPAAGLIVTLTQLGYGLGLLFIVPLADVAENRKLVTTTLVGATCALTLAASAQHAAVFVAAALLTGFSCVAAQVLLTYAAHLASDTTRGRVVGDVASGMLLGIMLARPVASLVADLLGWHAIFAVSAVLAAATALTLRAVLPLRQPAVRHNYLTLLESMRHLFITTSVLRRRGFYHACAFCAFSLFWTTVPLLLSSEAFELSQRAIALFALAGVSGAVAAPVAGRLADRGWSHACTGIAMGLIAIAFAMMLAVQPGHTGALAMLVIAAILLDMGVSANLVLSQRVIFSIAPEVRGRLNGLFMTMFFVGGAVGSSLGAWIYAAINWTAVLWVGLALPLISMAYFCTERHR